MRRIQTMYADGVLGNHGLLIAIGQLTAGVFNYIRAKDSTEYKLASILGTAYDYIVPPASPEEQQETVNNSLKLFLTAAPGFDSKKFKVNHG